MIRHNELIRSTGSLLGLLVLIAILMACWLNSLQIAPLSNPIVSVQWIQQTKRLAKGLANPLVSNDAMAIWREQTLPAEIFDQSKGAEQLWQWIDQQILLEDIETQGLSNEPVILEYIDFFAGQSFDGHQYSAYRLLKNTNMLQLSDREYKSEMVYLFPELPINIQGVQGERLLSSTQEVVEWKTEVIEQQSYVERLHQYLAKRRFEQRDNIHYGKSLLALEVEMKKDWRGWVLATGTFAIKGCPSIPFRHYFYHMGFNPISIPLPWWFVEDTDCINRYQDIRVQALDRFEVKFTEDDGYLNPNSTVWRMQGPGCQTSSREFDLDCIQPK